MEKYRSLLKFKPNTPIKVINDCIHVTNQQAEENGFRLYSIEMRENDDISLIRYEIAYLIEYHKLELAYLES